MQATVVKNPGHWIVTGLKGMSYPEFSSICKQVLSDIHCPREITVEHLHLTAAELGSAAKYSIWMAVT